MTGHLIYWGISAVTFVAFFGYWAWRLDRSHRRRMAEIEAEAARTLAREREAARALRERLGLDEEPEGRPEPSGVPAMQ